MAVLVEGGKKGSVRHEKISKSEKEHPLAKLAKARFQGGGTDKRDRCVNRGMKKCWDQGSEKLRSGG